MTKLIRPDRRQVMAGAGAGLMMASFGAPSSAQAKFKLRQGYQTNIWGMPTYYMVQSGILKKYGFEVEEFQVPSGNITMQQMVARQVDMGTYAGPSLMLGHDKGGIVAIALIEYVGKSNHVVARKDLGITKLEQLKGKKIANQTGSSTGNIFVDQIGPKYGLTKGTYQEVRMNVNDMPAAMSAKTVDAMVSVEPYSAILETDGIGNIIMNFSDFDRLPVFMAATPDYVEKNGEAVTAYLKAWIESGKEMKANPDKVGDVVHKFYTSKGYTMKLETMKKAMAGVEIDVGFPTNLVPYMTAHGEALVKENKIKALPDWKKLLRTDLMAKAMA
jgi:ABC-type nitrate/sulfonate/bicarbonate transport system substrate-binding protein